MGKKKLTPRDLKEELDELRARYPKLKYDELFVLWFVRAYVTEDTTAAAAALTGGSGDKGCDAIHIDDRAGVVFLVQGKYRETFGSKSEKRSDVISFADLATSLTGGNAAFSALKENLPAHILGRLQDARSRIRRRRYRLQLYFVTTGKVSTGLSNEAQSIVNACDREAGFLVFDGKKVLLLLDDYFGGVAPPVPSLDLEIEAGHGVQLGEILHRYDKRTDTESWVFPMTGAAVARLYEQAGMRLFARNVRGFLGENTSVNDGMKSTLRDEPEYFWYYNNGITIICDEAERRSRGGRNILRASNPQVINGQQTTYTIARNVERAQKASVVVRVIRVPREPGSAGESQFDDLVSRIVRATNFQNAIRASDLKSNDRRQVEIERRLRPLGYHYLRKRQAKSEARRQFGDTYSYQVKMKELAQAVAGCDLDPYMIRAGVENLFEEEWYDSIFPTDDPVYYLCRYRLMREVSYAARGSPERAYAKWLVLHYMWQKLSLALKSRAAKEHFIAECERQNECVGLLYKAIDGAFRAAIAMYKAKRGKGDEALDVSNFFYRRRLPVMFASFWRSGKNTHRPQFRSAWGRLEHALVDGLE